MGSSSKRSHRGERAHAGGGSHGPHFVALGALLALLAAALVWLTGSGIAGGHASAQDPVTMYEDPRAADLLVGGNDLIIAEKVAGIPEGPGLGAYSFAFFFNSQLVDVSVSEGPFLSSTGRTTTCFPSSSENLVQFSCSSTGTQPGPTGSGVLAYVDVRPKPGLLLRPTLGNGVFAVLDNLSQEAGLSDPLGESISVEQVLDAAVTVRALEADLDRNCVVDIVDAQRISYRYQAVLGSLQYRPFYDLVPPVAPDGDIGIQDLQFVYGRDGTTCDTDGDGMPDTYEPAHSCLNPLVPDGSADPDADGLTNFQEYNLGTDPCAADTDKDGMPDGSEAAHSCLYPLTADGTADADADGLSNLQEMALGTDPCKADTDGDGCKDGREYLFMPGFNPNAWYDFFDVPVPAYADPTANGPKNQAVIIGEVLGVLRYVGTYDGDGGVPNGNGVAYDSVKGSCHVNGHTAPDKEGLCYDRSTSPLPNPPWEAGPPNGAITMADVLVGLRQVGLNCSGPP